MAYLRYRKLTLLGDRDLTYWSRSCYHNLCILRRSVLDKEVLNPLQPSAGH